MRLVKGAGSEKTGACWMSAVHWYTRNDASWSDHPPCVSPVIASLAIGLNDSLPNDKERERVIGPHIFAPVGTATTLEDDQERILMVADRNIRVFAPFALKRTKLVKQMAFAAKLELLAVIDTYTELTQALSIMKAEHAYASAYAYANAYANANANAYANANANANAYANAREWWVQEYLKLILDLCKVGKVEVRPTKTKEEVLCFLNKSSSPY